MSFFDELSNEAPLRTRAVSRQSSMERLVCQSPDLRILNSDLFADAAARDDELIQVVAPQLELPRVSSTTIASHHSSAEQLAYQSLDVSSLSTDNAFAGVLSPDVYERHRLQLAVPELEAFSTNKEVAVLSKFARDFASLKRWSETLARQNGSGIVTTIRMVCTRRSGNTLLLYPGSGTSGDQLKGVVVAVAPRTTVVLPDDSNLTCRRIKKAEPFVKNLGSFAAKWGCEDLKLHLSRAALVVVYGTSDEWHAENSRDEGISLSIGAGTALHLNFIKSANKPRDESVAAAHIAYSLDNLHSLPVRNGAVDVDDAPKEWKWRM